MRDLTEDELREYFEFAKADRKAADFHLEQHKLIAKVASEIELMDSLGRKLAMGLKEGVHPEDLFFSLWIAAFQMGRECESRILTRALKATVKA